MDRDELKRLLRDFVASDEEAATLPAVQFMNNREDVLADLILSDAIRALAGKDAA